MPILTAVALLASTGFAAEPDPELLQQSKRQRRAGWLEIGGGATLVSGGLALMIAGRPSGELSTEDPTVHELRTMSGIGLLLGGVTTMIVGTDSLRQAASSREAALSVTPEPVAQGAGVRLSGRF